MPSIGSGRRKRPFREPPFLTKRTSATDERSYMALMNAEKVFSLAVKPGAP